MIDFPASPTTGQQFNAAGVTWTWDGTKWTGAGLNTPYLPLSGGTLSGPLTLVSDPTAALQPATKQYVDAGNVYPRDNRIINGDMRIDQRGIASGAGGTALGYTVDRWQFNASNATKGVWQRAGGPPGPNLAAAGFGYALTFTSNSAYTPLATDYFQFVQIVEADMVSDFAWGTPNAQPVTLSFWVNSSLTGTFSGVIGNDNGTRSYPFSYSISVASTWTKVAVTIPGDTGGTWVMSGNTRSLTVHFDLGAGANYRGPANAWASVNYVGVTGAVNVVGTNGAIFNVTGVKLEIGSVATHYNRQSLAKSLADCQRYYQVSQMLFAISGQPAGGQLNMSQPLIVTMRAVPTLTVLTNASANWTFQALGANVNMIANLTGLVVAAGQAPINVTFSAAAEL